MPINRDIEKRVTRFFEQGLCHVKGEWAGKPFKLEGWQQERVVAPLFATVDRRGLRKYRRLFLCAPRKNGKSLFGAGCALVTLILDDEPGAEVYSCGSGMTTADIVFSTAKLMIAASPLLQELVNDGRLKVYQSAITYSPDGIDQRVYRPRPSRADAAWGANVHCVIFDELHAVQQPEYWDAMQTASGSRRQPLSIVITTAGWDRNSLCWQEWRHAEQVRDGIIKDPTLLPVIYDAGPDDDWTDEQVWKKANPNLGKSIKIDYLRQQCAEAKGNPRKENAFRRLYLNQWTEQAERWLSMAAWDRCKHFDEAALIGQSCAAGMDLASTRDMSALLLAFELEDDDYALLAWFWCPETGIRERSARDHMPYQEWVDRGFLTAIPGDLTDQRQIRTEINEISEQYPIAEIAFDPWNATKLAIELRDEDGFEMIQFRQGTVSMNEPSRLLERIVQKGTCRHNDHPILRWNASNAAVHEDSAGNIRPDKKRSSEKIDGLVAAIMALGRASIRVDAGEDEGILVL